MKNQLDDFRRQIDKIDHLIINLLAKRIKVVEKIGRLKKQNHLPALDKKRWQKVLSRVKKIAEKKGLDKEFIEKIYQLIHRQSLKIERLL